MNVVALTGDRVRQGHVTLKVTLSISACIQARAMKFFLFLRLFNSGKSMEYKPISWPWQVTLYVKVTWPWKWLFLSPLVYMLEHSNFFVSILFTSEKSMEYKWMSSPWRVTLYVKVTWPWKWHFLSQLVYKLERWNFFLFLRFFNSGKSTEYKPMS